MKKISLLFLILLAYSASSMAQSNVPVPADPDGTFFEWYDYAPYQWPDGHVTVADGWFYLTYGMDVMGNLVADDYSFDIDSCWTHTLEYTILDKDKFSYSIYTDFDEIFVFQPEEYVEFTEPTTNVYIFNILPPNPNGGYNSSTNFEFWGPHFPNRTTLVDGFEDLYEPFPLWRIGIQTHYTVDGVTTSSNIIYYEVCPKPVTLLGDVNDDGVVNIKDVTALINYLLTDEGDPFNKFNADTNDDNKHSITDVTALINYLLTDAW